jgi:nicotinate dehydrogenase subunit A
MKLDLHVNGTRRPVEAEPDQSLLSVLRDELALTGAKYGCGEGQCGACTVLLDGQAVRSCITPVSAAAGKPVVTIEGLANGGKLHPVQESFLREDAYQCGYCTAGMIMAAVALLKKNPDATEEQVRRGLEGNICRCCAYGRIVKAVQGAAKSARGGAK